MFFVFLRPIRGAPHFGRVVCPGFGSSLGRTGLGLPLVLSPRHSFPFPSQIILFNRMGREAVHCIVHGWFLNDG